MMMISVILSAVVVVVYFRRHKFLFQMHVERIRTATLGCRTRKRAFHFCSPGVVRRRHAAALHVRPAALAAAAASAAAAADAAVYIANLLIKILLLIN